MTCWAVVTRSSEGVVLIYGRDERAIEAGVLLKDRLDVTVMLSAPRDVPARDARTRTQADAVARSAETGRVA